MTHHQIKILKMISLGFNTRQIANELYLSENTIKTHRKDIIRALEARNACHAVRLWMEKNSRNENIATPIDAHAGHGTDLLDD